MRYDTFAMILMDFVAMLNDRETITVDQDEQTDSI